MIHRNKLRPISDRIRTPIQDPGIVIVTNDNAEAYAAVVTSKFQIQREKILANRRIANSTYVDSAIDDIVNEGIGPSLDGLKVSINLDRLGLSDEIKNSISDEWERVLSITGFDENIEDQFRRWYVDGRQCLYLIPHDNIEDGLKEVRELDSTHITKLSKIVYDENRSVNDNLQSFEVRESFAFFPPNETDQLQSAFNWNSFTSINDYVELDEKVCVWEDSGLMDENNHTESYLTRSAKALNQLTMQEDSLVIYRLVKAPERRVWYIDVGNLPKTKAEEYIKGLIAKQRSKVSYNSLTGGLTTSADVRTMMDELYLPTRGGEGTKVDSLPGGQNLGEIDDIMYFQRKLYTAMKVPLSRISSEGSFSMGRGAEITRDEVKFTSFVKSLTRRHSNLFKQVLGVQLILRKVMTKQEWDSAKDKIYINYVGNSHFGEIKELEMMTERLNLIDRMHQYVGVYFTTDDVKRVAKVAIDTEIAEEQEPEANNNDSVLDNQKDNEYEQDFKTY